ncbi:MAG: DNA adenine methylase [Opitutaceae bacterium]|jgi:DNA adenine methylase|nr:DNA adenine methylase [Opitutaceae bacterium]
MKAPQPFQYQGSKRILAPLILRYLPGKMKRLIEPFAGSAAISLACATEGRAGEYWLNDYNQPLAGLLSLIINRPEEISEHYARIWRDNDADPLEHYYRVREDFNCVRDPKLFLYLLARCVKGSVRYNADGLFNQSPDKRRLGTHPATMKQNIMAVSSLLRGRSIITSQDYRDILASARPSDVVYMDPPYQGVCGERDSRYYSGITSDDFVAALDQLNTRDIQYVVSYDGHLGARSYGEQLPAYLGLTLLEVEAGRSSQATLLGRDEQTVESLYISRNLASELNIKPARLSRTAPLDDGQLHFLAIK